MTKGISCLMKSICSCLPNSDRSGYDLKNVAKNASNKPEVELSSIWYTEERKGIETSVRKASTADRPQTACAAEHRTEGEINQDDSKINEWQAGWNIANVIQGMFTMSYPYAIRYGGFWAIFSMIAVPYISCYTGKILVACLYELNER
ncbi:Vesicular inhibitory amino acid transporter, partial [Stegodyphus mimosarum]